MSVTTLCMPKDKKAPTTTVRVTESLAADLEVIVDYLEDTTGKAVTVASLLAQWCKPHIERYREKAIDHRIERLRRMKQMDN